MMGGGTVAYTGKTSIRFYGAIMLLIWDKNINLSYYQSGFFSSLAMAYWLLLVIVCAWFYDSVCMHSGREL